MTATDERVYRLGEFHGFEAGGRRFLYLVQAGAIFEVDQSAATLIDRLREGEAGHETLLADLVARGLQSEDAEELLEEMYQARVVVAGKAVPEPPQNAPADFPLMTLVLNLTNQCNLSCQYCYEF